MLLRERVQGDCFKYAQGQKLQQWYQSLSSIPAKQRSEVTLLSQVDPKAYTQSTSNTVISIIKSLIGHFDLDPNRVFDIVLECFELQPDNDIFFDLIPIFPKSHASQILGFKFQYYQRMEVGHNVPHRLYRLTALLVKSNFIDLDSMADSVLLVVTEEELGQVAPFYCK